MGTTITTTNAIEYKINTKIQHTYICVFERNQTTIYFYISFDILNKILTECSIIKFSLFFAVEMRQTKSFFMYMFFFSTFTT